MDFVFQQTESTNDAAIKNLHAQVITALITQNTLMLLYLYTFYRMFTIQGGRLDFILFIGILLASTCVTWQLNISLQYKLVKMQEGIPFVCVDLS